MVRGEIKTRIFHLRCSPYFFRSVVDPAVHQHIIDRGTADVLKLSFVAVALACKAFSIAFVDAMYCTFNMRLILQKRLMAALLLLLLSSIAYASNLGITKANTQIHFPNKCIGLIGDELHQCLNHHRRRIQEDVPSTILTDVPAACEGWKENKIHECIAEQALIGSILSHHDLDHVPSECAGLNTDKLDACLMQRQTILDENGVTDVPSDCQGLGVDKLNACIVEYNLVQVVLSEHNLQSIPSECTGLNAAEIGACLTKRQTILDENGVTDVPSNCQGLTIDKLDACILDHNLVQTVLNQHNLNSIPSECGGLKTDELGECLTQRQSILDQNGVTSVPSDCLGLGVDKLDACIVEYNLVQAVLSQHNLNSIPSECTGVNTDKLDGCLSQRQSILDENNLKAVPAECKGLSVDKLGACLIDYNLLQSILTSNNIKEVPTNCAGQNADKLTECLRQWRLTQIILGVSDERIPPECVGMEKEKDLEACLEEFTLAPTRYPTYSPTSSVTTYAPTTSPVALEIDVQANFEEEEEEEEETFDISKGELAAVSIGRYAMSITKYLNNRHRGLRKQNDANHPRRHELDATRKFLREVYQEEFGTPVARVDLHFVDSGETALGLKKDGTAGDRITRHSIFFGNALFVKDDANPTQLPTKEELEKVTINAFTGEHIKQAFIEKYHYEVTGRKYFGIKYSYDVNVRKNLQSITVASEEEADLSRADQKEVTWFESIGTRTFLICFILIAGILLGTLIGLSVLVLRRKRSDREHKLRSQVMLGDCIDDEPDALGSVIDSEIETGSDMLYSEYVTSSHQVQTSLPIIADDFEDSVSQLATSDDDSVYKATDKEKIEVDSGDSTKEVESGDSDSTWSYSLKSDGSRNKSGRETDASDVDVEHQMV